MTHRSKNIGTKNGRYIPRGGMGEKTCSQCRHPRPLSSFNVDKSRFDGRGYVCALCRDKRRRKPGPTVRERRQKRSEGLAWCGGCHAWHPAEAICGARCRPCANRYARDLYGRSAEFRRRRRGRAVARRRGVDPIPPSGADLILEEFDGQCAYCPAPATTWDHVVAVKKGGITEPANMVPACASCNSSKRTQNVWAWLRKTGRTPHQGLFERLMLHQCGMPPGSGPDPFEGA